MTAADTMRRLVDASNPLISAMARLCAAAVNLRDWGIEHDDSRIAYISVQINRIDADELIAALAALDAVCAGRCAAQQEADTNG